MGLRWFAAGSIALVSALAIAATEDVSAGTAGRARSSERRRGRRHDRARRRPSCPAPPDRHAGAGDRRVLLAGRGSRAPAPPSERLDGDARGGRATRPRGRIRAPASIRPPRRGESQPRARPPRGGHRVALSGRARTVRRSAPRRRADGAPRAPRAVGCVPERRVEPARAGDDGDGGAPAPPRGIVGGGCDPSYPTVCIPSPPPDLDCADIEYRRFRVVPPDPHRFDGEGDGIGCER